MRDDLIETSEIIHRISNYSRHFFNISLRTGNLMSRLITKTKFPDQLEILTKRFIYFWNKYPN